MRALASPHEQIHSLSPCRRSSNHYLFGVISYSEALAKIADRSPADQVRTPSETVPLMLADGRILAVAITAQEDIPGADNSAMDGYAVRSADTGSATPDQPVWLSIAGEAPAERPFDAAVGPDQAVRIMTGAPIPTGADAVVMVEKTEESDGRVGFREPVVIGTAIRRAGEDIRSGSDVLSAGRRLSPPDLGLLASLGVTNVPVRIRPILALISTGSELVEPFDLSGPGRIRNSSAPPILAAAARLGVETIDLGICGDDPEELALLIETGLRYDILLTTGGVSAGAYDHVQHLLPAAGVDIAFHQVAIKPGKPVMFGTHTDGDEKTFVYGLPGNPVSSYVTTELFVRPLVERMLGLPDRDRTIGARLAGEVTKKDSKRHFVRVFADFSGKDGPIATPAETQSSGAMTSLSDANGLLIFEEEEQMLPAGTDVRILLLPGSVC